MIVPDKTFYHSNMALLSTGLDCDMNQVNTFREFLEFQLKILQTQKLSTPMVERIYSENRRRNAHQMEILLKTHREAYDG